MRKQAQSGGGGKGPGSFSQDRHDLKKILYPPIHIQAGYSQRLIDKKITRRGRRKDKQGKDRYVPP